ncbi:MAG: hypothetical protein H6Q16_29 [Bacteroidetes bacterium]|nr:hypothetical protein [Bacteroidota bacterium]
MITNSKRSKYEKYVESTEINKILKFDSMFLESFYDYLEMMDYSTSQYKRKPAYSIFFSIGGIIIGIIIGFYIRLKYKNTKINNADFEFISSPSHFNRFIEVNSYIHNSIIIYMPEFYNKLLLSNLRQHKENNNNIYVITYSLSTLFFYLKNLLHNWKIYKKIICLSKTNILDIRVQNAAIAFLLKYILYKQSIEKIGAHIFKNKIIVFDHDKAAYSYLFKQITNKTVTLCHGSFVGNNLYYVRSLANYILSTCLREKNTIIKYSNNIEENNIFSVGVPLQSFELYKSLKMVDKKDKILIIGTTGHFEMQITLLRFLNETNANYIYRFRPASKNKDYEILRDYLNIESISIIPSLEEDCSHYKKIISFSLDALGTCIRNKNQILIYISNEEYNNYDMVGICTNEIIVTSDNDVVKDFILSPYIIIEEYSENTEKWIIDNIGHYQKDRVYNNIVSALKLILDD